MRLVYADRKLVVAMAVPLVGLQSQKTVQRGGSSSWNWLIQAEVSRGTSASVLQDIRELLPEELAHGLHHAIPEDRKGLSTYDAVRILEATGDDAVLPGSPLSVKGVLRIPGLEHLEESNPFKPPPIELETFMFHGEPCFAGSIQQDAYRLPAYFSDEARAQVAYCHNNPVELTGILRWCPPYSPGGAASLQLALRVAIVWLA